MGLCKTSISGVLVMSSVSGVVFKEINPNQLLTEIQCPGTMSSVPRSELDMVDMETGEKGSETAPGNLIL